MKGTNKEMETKKEKAMMLSQLVGLIRHSYQTTSINVKLPTNETKWDFVKRNVDLDTWDWTAPATYDFDISWTASDFNKNQSGSMKIAVDRVEEYDSQLEGALFIVSGYVSEFNPPDGTIYSQYLSDVIQNVRIIDDLAVVGSEDMLQNANITKLSHENFYRVVYQEKGLK